MANEARISDDEDDHESADYYVCARATSQAHFTDDLYDFCCECGEKVRYRPYGPRAPKKICLECAMPSMVKAKERGELEVVSSNRSADEFREKTGKALKPSEFFEHIKK